MSPNTHRILRQVLDLDLGRSDNVVELQQMAAQVLKHQGMAAIERVFNQLSDPRQVVRLERLEVDLGALRGPDWPAQFAQRLAERLEQSLEQSLRHQGATAAASAVTPETSQFEQLLFFCRQGRLPWWGSKPSPQWLEQLQTTITPAQWHRLSALLRRDQRALQRLIYTASDGFLQTLLQRFHQWPESSRVLQQLSPPNRSPSIQSQWRERFWHTLLTQAVAAEPIAGSRLMAQLLTARQRLQIADPAAGSESEQRPSPFHQGAAATEWPPLPAPWQQWLQQAIQSWPTERPSPSPDRPGADSSQAAADRQASPSPPTGDRQSSEEEEVSQAPVEPAAADPTGQGDAESGTAAAIDPDRSGAPSTDARFHPSTDDRSPWVETASQPAPSPSVASGREPPLAPLVAAPVDEEVFVDAAGMVILHPFLQELFRSLDLLAERQFCDRHTQRRAVALLTYLGFGDIAVQEYELLLPKLLAAWPWAEPLPPYELTAAERLSCDELMAAILRHWSALRSRSPDWLRETFFWREGKLTPVDMGWRLTIEPRAQDVLLNRLPWGIGVIRLPWMTDFLHVSWTS